MHIHEHVCTAPRSCACIHTIHASTHPHYVYTQAHTHMHTSRNSDISTDTHTLIRPQSLFQASPNCRLCASEGCQHPLPPAPARHGQDVRKQPGLERTFYWGGKWQTTTIFICVFLRPRCPLCRGVTRAHPPHRFPVSSHFRPSAARLPLYLLTPGPATRLWSGSFWRAERALVEEAFVWTSYSLPAAGVSQTHNGHHPAAQHLPRAYYRDSQRKLWGGRMLRSFRRPQKQPRMSARDTCRFMPAPRTPTPRSHLQHPNSQKEGL